MTEAAEKQELGWTPKTFDEDLDGADRGDTIGLAETEEAQEAVAQDSETEALQEDGDTADVDSAEGEADAATETGDEPAAVDTDAADTGDVEAAQGSDAEQDDKKPHMIPKDRLDQELAKRRQLENKLKELEEQVKNKEKVTETVDFDFDDAETRYMTAVLDGETDKARQIRAEIRQMERTQLQNELKQSMQETSQRTQAQIRLDNAVQEIVSQYPQMDINGEAPDQDLINETNELMAGFLSAGYDPVDALKKAVGYTTATLGLNMGVNEPAVIQNSVDRNLAEEKAAKKTAASAEKKAQAAKQQPPKLSGESQRSRDGNVVDIFSLNEKEFSTLSDEQLRKLRGDFG